MITWPGDPAVTIEPSRRIAKGDAANVSEIHLGSHTGTHVDPPFHFLEEGATVEAMSLEALFGPAEVVDLSHVEEQILVDDLESANLSSDAQRVLLKTSNSQIWSGPPRFPDSYVALSPQAAQWLVDRHIKLVGIDFLSIERRRTPGHPTHKALLGAGIVIVEGLDLRDVQPGTYTLACLPLKILEGDGAPARAILLTG